MNYFSRRNNHIVEYSGYEEVSDLLRVRLLAILNKYIAKNMHSYGGDDPWCVDIRTFSHDVGQEFPGEDYFTIIQQGSFHKVFTIVEMFLDGATEIYFTRRKEVLIEIFQAFKLSGSVYTINNERRVELVVATDLAKKIQDVKQVLGDNTSAYEKFFNAVGNLFGRKAKADDIVKDVFVAFEDYLKEKTKKNDYGSAVAHLEKQGVISVTQKALLEKIYAYRSDTYGVVHSGNSKKPGEVDALWFVETVIPQLLFVDRKLKQNIA